MTAIAHPTTKREASGGGDGLVEVIWMGPAPEQDPTEVTGAHIAPQKSTEAASPSALPPQEDSAPPTTDGFFEHYAKELDIHVDPKAEVMARISPTHVGTLVLGHMVYRPRAGEAIKGIGPQLLPGLLESIVQAHDPELAARERAREVARQAKQAKSEQLAADIAEYKAESAHLSSEQRMINYLEGLLEISKDPKQARRFALLDQHPGLIDFSVREHPELAKLTYVERIVALTEDPLGLQTNFKYTNSTAPEDVVLDYVSRLLDFNNQYAAKFMAYDNQPDDVAEAARDSWAQFAYNSPPASTHTRYIDRLLVLARNEARNEQIIDRLHNMVIINPDPALQKYLEGDGKSTRPHLLDLVALPKGGSVTVWYKRPTNSEVPILEAKEPGGEPPANRLPRAFDDVERRHLRSVVSLWAARNERDPVRRDHKGPFTHVTVEGQTYSVPKRWLLEGRAFVEAMVLSAARPSEDKPEES